MESSSESAPTGDTSRIFATDFPAILVGDLATLAEKCEQVELRFVDPRRLHTRNQKLTAGSTQYMNRKFGTLNTCARHRLEFKE